MAIFKKGLVHAHSYHNNVQYAVVVNKVFNKVFIYYYLDICMPHTIKHYVIMKCVIYEKYFENICVLSIFSNIANCQYSKQRKLTPTESFGMQSGFRSWGYLLYLENISVEMF